MTQTEKEAAAEFKTQYAKAKTWKDADELIATLAPADRTRLFEAMQIVDAFTGLDMRQEFYRNILRHANV